MAKTPLESVVAPTAERMGLAEQAAFLNSILESSTEYSIVAKEHTSAEFSHGLCPPCAQRLFGEEAAG